MLSPSRSVGSGTWVRERLTDRPESGGQPGLAASIAGAPRTPARGQARRRRCAAFRIARRPTTAAHAGGHEHTQRERQGTAAGRRTATIDGTAERWTRERSLASGDAHGAALVVDRDLERVLVARRVRVAKEIALGLDLAAGERPVERRAPHRTRRDVACTRDDHERCVDGRVRLVLAEQIDLDDRRGLDDVAGNGRELVSARAERDLATAEHGALQPQPVAVLREVLAGHARAESVVGADPERAAAVQARDAIEVLDLEHRLAVADQLHVLDLAGDVGAIEHERRGGAQHHPRRHADLDLATGDHVAIAVQQQQAGRTLTDGVGMGVGAIAVVVGLDPQHLGIARGQHAVRQRDVGAAGPGTDLEVGAADVGRVQHGAIDGGHREVDRAVDLVANRGLTVTGRERHHACERPGMGPSGTIGRGGSHRGRTTATLRVVYQPNALGFP
ncbi:MAG: hypothetical protein IPN32_19010 [Deltaproteobacteria bacterium]|nr:hypothetical protein [Deltaproteobacteria bacterium]